MNNSIYFRISKYCLLFLFFPAGVTFSADLEINDQKGTTGELVTFTVSINNAPNDLNNLEFNILYDKEILNFEGWEKGQLVQDFAFFHAAPLKGGEGVLKVAGLTSNPIPADTTSEVVYLKFRGNECHETKLELSGLQGSIEGFSTRDGVFRCK